MSNVSFAPDVTLSIDLSGVIRRAALSAAMAGAGHGSDEWVGRLWVDTVDLRGADQVRKMLDDALLVGVSSFRRVLQRFPGGREVPIEYTAVRLGGEDGLLAIGRIIEAVADVQSRVVASQAAMERDAWKLREVETRYRLLFDASAEPTILVDSLDLRILEANPAALRAVGSGDQDLLARVRPSERSGFREMLARVRDRGHAPGIVIHLGRDPRAWLARASLFSSERETAYVLQLSPSGAVPYLVPPPGESPPAIDWDDLIARLPDGFVVLDGVGTILWANEAFASLVGRPPGVGVVGQRFERWLPPAEAGVLMTCLLRAPGVQELSGTIECESGARVSVAISLARKAESSSPFVGVLVRRVRRLDLGGKQGGASILDAVAAIERRCAEAAAALVEPRRAPRSDPPSRR